MATVMKCGMPKGSIMLAEPVIRRVDVLAAQGHPGAQALATYFVGQGVGLMNKVKPAREVVREEPGVIKKKQERRRVD